MAIEACTPQQFSTRTELLALVYALDKFIVYVFDHDCFNQETINKYCCILVPSHDATFTSSKMYLHDFGIDYCFHLTQGRHPIYIYIHTYIHTYTFPKFNNSVTQQLHMKQVHIRQHILHGQDNDYKTN
jgi:hypothetical protein